MAPKVPAGPIECEIAEEHIGRMRLDENCSSKIGGQTDAPVDVQTDAEVACPVQVAQKVPGC